MKKTLISLGIIGIAASGFWAASTYLNQNDTELPRKRMESRLSGAQILDLKTNFLGNPGNNTGNFLAAQFAQRQQRWNDAQKFLAKLDKDEAQMPLVLKQSMILDLNDGELDKAAEAAKQVLALETEDEITRTLASLIIITQDFKNEDYEQARADIKTMPQSQLSVFMEPILESWLQAANGQYEIRKLQSNLLYVMHAIYIADYLNDAEKVKTLLGEVRQLQDLTAADIEHFADIYAHIKEYTEARALYENLLLISPHSDRIKIKIDMMNKLAKGEITTPPAYYQAIKAPAQGLSRAYYDMAYILFRDQADESARIFATMALSVNPDFARAHILLASMADRYSHYDQAIAHYKKVLPSSPYYRETRREAANAYEKAGKNDQAISELKALYDEEKDLEALIQIGDTYRRTEDFKSAIKYYNQAATLIGEPLPADYWYLYYVRGMSYEQSGAWELGEKDLLAALTFQPNHPYVLNYLGYAWADKGLNLDKAMVMIDQALASQPHDGYITDSLGWVNFKLGHYKESVPLLEKAVELLPGDPVVNDHLGDAYWQIGRKIEARYQWQRAEKYAKDEAMKEKLADKIENGLQHVETIKAADNAEDLPPSLQKEKETAMH